MSMTIMEMMLQRPMITVAQPTPVTMAAITTPMTIMVDPTAGEVVMTQVATAAVVDSSPKPLN
jgi:hypothetical protein